MIYAHSQTVAGPVLALSLAGVAAAIGVSKRTAAAWRQRGLLLEPAIQHGRIIRWLVSDVQAWIARGGPARGRDNG